MQASGRRCCHVGRPVARCCLRVCSRAPVKVAASLNPYRCPYDTLGVKASASESEIKSAFRRLVLRFHPDVSTDVDQQHAEARFMSIQQAYELLTKKGGGGAGANGRPRADGDWDWHDWFWSFQQKRRWGGYKRGSAAAAAAAAEAAEPQPGTPLHQQPQHQATLRTQLAGLRHRAAVRANKRPMRGAAAAAAAGAGAGAAVDEDQSSSSEQAQATASMEYDSSEMSDGCNMASGVSDWAATAATARPARFSASESHKQQVHLQMAGLHRMAARQQSQPGSGL